MLNIYFVRHGETDSNKRRTYCGWTDIGLNEAGLADALHAASYLKDKDIYAIFTSTLKRAAETAITVNKFHGLKLNESIELKERNFGIWDDLTLDEIRQNYPCEYEEWCSNWRNYRILNGETATEAEQRVISFIEDIKSSYVNCSVVVVSHLGSIRTMLAHLLDMGAEQSWRFSIENGKIAHIVINDEGYAYLAGLNL